MPLCNLPRPRFWLKRELIRVYRATGHIPGMFSESKTSFWQTGGAGGISGRGAIGTGGGEHKGGTKHIP